MSEALDILRWTSLTAGEPVYKMIMSATANAKNNAGLNPDTLFISTVYANEGPTSKRVRPRAQGRAFKIRKRTCHMTVIVESCLAKNAKYNKGISTDSMYVRSSNSNKTVIKRFIEAKEGSK